MGRNDFSSMVTILFKKGCNLKQFVLNYRALIIILGIFFVNNSIAFSDEPNRGEQPVTYKIAPKYHTNVSNIIRYTEVSEFTRVYDDSSTQSYKRELTFFFSLNCRSLPENGFQTLDVAIDSMLYKFTEGNAVYKFDSQAEIPGDITFSDYIYTGIPLSKTYDMVYSPYGEVAKLEGEKLDWFRNYIVKEGVGIIDSVETFLWLDGISPERLKHITNLQKILFLPGPITKDSTWKSVFNLQIDRKNFQDTVDVRIERVKEGFIFVEAVSKNLRSLPQQSIFYGIKNTLLPVLDSKGEGTFKMELSPKGTVRNAEANFVVDIKSKVKKSPFTDKVKTRMTWVLLGQYEI